MPKNRCKVLVLTLVLASMIVSGCSNSNMNPTKPETAAGTAEVTASAKEKAEDDDEAGASVASKSNDDEKEKQIAKDYLDRLKDAFHKYSSSSKAYTDDLEAEKFDDARKDLEDMENALNELGNIDTPEKYHIEYTVFCDTLRPEHDYVNLCRRFMVFCEKRDSLTKEDEIEIQALTDEMALTPVGFSEKFLSLVKKVKADIEK